MTDRELLELAAKAAGIELRWHPDGAAYADVRAPGYWGVWNPLEDDGDALRLAVKLQLQVTPGTYNKDEFSAYKAGRGEASERCNTLQDEYAATRRAITRAAAEIGKAMS